MISTNASGDSMIIHVNAPPAYNMGTFMPMYANMADINRAVVILENTSLK